VKYRNSKIKMTNQNAKLLTFALSRLPKNLFGGQAFCTFIFAFCISEPA